MRKVFRGIQALHPAREKQAKPLQLHQLEQVVQWLESSIDRARLKSERGTELRHVRNKALLLMGFWRGFRGDELTRLQVEHVTVLPGEGMICYFSQTKSDRRYQGSSFKTPTLSRLCPVEAFVEWINAAQLTSGAVFRAIDRWGHISDVGLHEDSLIPIFRSALSNAGVESADLYSGHSLRRGFANWATSNGWNIKTLMEYVGWKNVQSAMRYVEAADSFSKVRIESDLTKSLPSLNGTTLID